MTSHFFKLSFRNLFRRKFSSLVNILGLAIGFTGFIAISLYVIEEKSYDRYLTERHRIHRIVHNTFNKDRNVIILSALFHDHLKGLPELESTVRVLSYNLSGNMRSKEKELLERKFIMADAEFFPMFGFELASGSLAQFEAHPNSIVLTKSAAHRYFGDKNPIGEILNYSDFIDYTVVGILKDLPGKSHLDFEVVANYESMRNVNNHMFTHWGNHSTVYYLKLRPDADSQQMGNKIFDLYDEVRGTKFRENGHTMYLQPVNQVYLHSVGIESSSFMRVGNATTLYIFSISAILILLLACVNYINLTTARATLRAREVGVRKVLGAGRLQLMKHFLGESLLLCLLSFLVSLGFLELFLPVFSQIVGAEILMPYANLGFFWWWLLIIVLLVSLLSGFYPGMVLSGFKPLDVLKGSIVLINRKVQSGLNLNLRYRQVLIILQISISVGLVLASTFIIHQNKFALTQPGFEKENLIVIYNPHSANINQNYHRLKNALEGYPFVLQVSAGAHVPTESVSNLGRLHPTDKSSEEAQPIYFAPVDFNYFETLGIRLLDGRTFNLEYSTDSTHHVVLNQSAAKALGLVDPLGHTLKGFWDGIDKQVIGLVEDVNFQSVHNKVQPTAYFMNYVFREYGPGTMRIMVRFKHDNIREVVEGIEKAWQEIIPGVTMIYYFMDQQYTNLYQTEIQTAGMGRLFSYFAIILAVLGLWGTTSYVLNAKRKEFGIRKVLGASSLRLAAMISKEFSIMVLIASVIAWPLVYYFVDNWLDNFVYRIDIPLLPFLLFSLLAWGLCMFIVNTIALHEASRNPVESLKYE